MKLLLGVIFLLLFSPVIYAQSSKDSIVMLPVSMAAPANAKKIGSIREGNNSVKTLCDYEEIVKAAKDKARAIGGNIVKITKLDPPTFISKCYRIEADVYHISELPANLLQKSNEANAPLPVKSDHAVLYLYRLKDTIALTATYHLHINDDSVTYSVRSRTRDSVIIYKEGPVTLWAKAEKRIDLKLDVKFGHVYYIRCGLTHGDMWWLPELEVVDNVMGEKEYGHLRKGKKNMSVSYL